MPQRVVERPPVQRAAAVALAVRADDEERPSTGSPRLAAGERRREVDAEQVVVVLELQLEEPLLPRAVSVPKNTRPPGLRPRAPAS